MKACIKTEKIIKFGNIEMQKQKFHQHKRPISMKNIDINWIGVSNEISFGKKDFKYVIGYKRVKKLDFYPYFSQKWVHLEKTLMKLNICVFGQKMMNYWKNRIKFGKKLKIVSKKNLIVNQYTTQKYVKAKIKYYNGKINTDFHNNKIAKESSQFICLSVILIDSFF